MMQDACPRRLSWLLQDTLKQAAKPSSDLQLARASAAVHQGIRVQ